MESRELLRLKLRHLRRSQHELMLACDLDGSFVTEMEALNAELLEVVRATEHELAAAREQDEAQ